MRLPIHVGCLAAAFAVFCCPVKAQQWDVPRFSDDAKAVYAAASKPVSKAGTDTVVLDDEESYVFDADGRVLRTSYVVYKVLTQKGADAWGDVALSWEPWHEEKPTLRARVITSDEVVHTLDAATIADSPAKDDEDNVYGDRRVVRAPLPAIAPGSVVEEEDILRESPTIVGAGILRRVYFGRGVPVQHSRLVLDAPSSLPLHYTQDLLPDLKPQRTETGDRVRVSFDYGAMEALDDADGNLPSDVAPYPEVRFSSGISWSQLAEEYGRVVDDRIAKSDVKTLVSKLIAGKQSVDAKVQAILQYVGREVRYTGVEFGDAAVVPHSPTEVLTHKYGDCKDKSVLLVAMLRSAGIPAYVALLDAGERQDVAPDLPGMGLFDHAIVYVPGVPDLWVDGTDEYARLGQLPASDQGRYALVIRPGTGSLVRTAVTSSKDNTLIEKREFYLAENGPARVVEISQPHGDLESAYRAAYGDKQSKNVRENLTKYVKDQYLAEKLEPIDHSDPTDLSKQFELTLTSDRAKRGFTDLDSAVAAIRLEGIFYRLPSELQTRETEEDPKAESSNEKPKKKRTADFQLQEPFVTEWQYTLVPPAGFRPKPLPKDAKMSLGPGELTEEFSSDKDGVVHAVIRFDTVRSRMSASEATEMRNAVAQVKEGEPILVRFEPIAAALLNEGKVREAFQSYRDLIAFHPKEAVHHLQLAEALLSAGMGEPAREEARLGVRLDPNSALAEKTLANILEYDSVGRKFRPGSDYEGAAAAFRAAEKLDPDDKTIVGNLAILLEFDRRGLRYGPGAQLDRAISEYDRLTAEELANMGLKNNLAVALFYAGKFADAEKNAEALNPQPSSLIVACEAALNGSQAGLVEAKKRTSDQDQFKSIVENAGQMLKNIRKYSLAADFLETGASGNLASSQMSAAAIFHNAELHEKIVFPDNPAALALHYYLLEIDPNVSLDLLRSLASRNGKIALATPDVLKAYIERHRASLSRQSRDGEFPDVWADFQVATAQPLPQGNDATGYKVILWRSYSYKSSIYVLKEEGKYRVLATGTTPYGVGLEVLDRVASHDLDGARTLLDWLREDWALAGGDEPLAGWSFTRLWTKGKDADPSSMRLAAASILVKSKQTVAQGIQILEAAKTSTNDPIQMVDISLALLEGYNTLQAYDKAIAICGELSKKYPESKYIFENLASELGALGHFKEADALAQERLKRIPDDLDAQRALVYNLVEQGDHSGAHRLGIRILNSSPNVESPDFNNVAWQSLFAGDTGDEDLGYAIKAAQLGQNGFSVLHTLGCVYAELGKTKEARDVLIQAMDAANYDELEPNTWYAFGRIAEQDGETQIAITDYSRVEKPESAYGFPGSSYELAQIHLKRLQAASNKTATTR